MLGKLRKFRIEAVWQDLKSARRSLRRSPGFAIVVIATLAIGIGANLTMFSLMRAVLWRPLPYPQSDRLVIIQVDARNVSNTGATMGEIYDLRQRSRTLEQVSAINAVDANLEADGDMEHVSAASVSDDFLPLLGARPAVGRALDSRTDESSDQVLAILISDQLVASPFFRRSLRHWQRCPRQQSQRTNRRRYASQIPSFPSSFGVR